jgi:hypothetical protein
MAKTVQRVRSAVTGKYTKKSQAKRNPRTTVTERDKVKPRKKTK